jgi:hypothetical protein
MRLPPFLMGRERMTAAQGVQQQAAWNRGPQRVEMAQGDLQTIW